MSNWRFGDKYFPLQVGELGVIPRGNARKAIKETGSEGSGTDFQAVYESLIARNGALEGKRFNYPIPYGDDNCKTHPRCVFVDALVERARKEME